MIKARFEQLEGNEICVVDVSRAPIPAYMRGDQGSEFYVRTGNTSRLLDSAETVRYIAMHWD